MTAFLLDTHVVVWLATEPLRVPSELRASLETAEELLVSAASAYEIAQQVRLGRLPQAQPLLARWNELLETMLAVELPLTSADMMHAGVMPWDHRDPFDRMLVAQAQLRGLPLVTKDDTIRAFPAVTCTWG